MHDGKTGTSFASKRVKDNNGRTMIATFGEARVSSITIVWGVNNDMAKEYEAVELQNMYIDNASMQLVKEPKQFDVILTTNMFGDILSDLASMLTGSIGMLPSASLAENGTGMYEPVHGLSLIHI